MRIPLAPISIIALFTTALFGCGLKVIPVSQLPPSDSPTSLSALRDESIGTASATTNAGELLLQTFASAAHPIGAYAGGGTGNKALIGVRGFHRTSLASLDSIFGEAAAVNSALTPYLNLIVDLDCVTDENPDVNTVADYRSRRRIIVGNWTGVVGGDGYTTYTAVPTASIWAISGAATGGLPTNGGGMGKLSDFAAAYPAACIVDGISDDGGLGRDVTDSACDTGAGLAGTALGHCGKSHSGVLVVLGGSTNVVDSGWRFRKVGVNGTVYH